MSRAEWKLLFWLTWTALVGVTAALLLVAAQIAHAETRHGTASYYTVASCKKEGTTGIMANGRRLDDTKLTAASWDYPFGTRLQVCRAGKTPCVTVRVADRGPSHRLYRQGRIVDLSKAAFESLAPISQGVIQVTVKEVS